MVGVVVGVVVVVGVAVAVVVVVAVVVAVAVAVAVVVGMSDRTQEARERAEAKELVRRVHHAREMIYDAEAAGSPNIAAIDHWERQIDESLDALSDRVAALETALRKIQDVYGTDDCTCIVCTTCRDALAGGGGQTETPA